jgi:hypothetical protein
MRLHRPSPAQFRAARAWANWTRTLAADRAILSTATVMKLEEGDPRVRDESVAALASMYRAAGFVFSPLGMGRNPNPTTPIVSMRDKRVVVE